MTDGSVARRACRLQRGSAVPSSMGRIPCPATRPTHVATGHPVPSPSPRADQEG